MKCRFCDFTPQPKQYQEEMLGELRDHVWWKHSGEWSQIQAHLDHHDKLEKDFIPFEDSYEVNFARIHTSIGIRNGRSGHWRKSA